jgi:uncharacterized protein
LWLYGVEPSKQPQHIHQAHKWLGGCRECGNVIRNQPLGYSSGVKGGKMIQLGCNFSPELMNLLKNDKVDIDWIKLSNEELFNRQFLSVDNLKPVLLHFIPRISSSVYLDGWDFNGINKLLSQCRSPHVAIHFRVEQDDYKMKFTREIFKVRVLELLKHISKNINVELLIENMPSYCLPLEYQFLAEPSFIKEVCEESGIGLLLDLAHLEISAWNYNEDKVNYLKKLPLNSVKEIHISGPRFIGSDYRDEHELMREEDLKLLETTLLYTNPKIITLEYGAQGEEYIELIESEINRLRKYVV